MEEPAEGAGLPCYNFIMDGKSLDLTAEKLAQLRALFPEAFSEDKVDFARHKSYYGRIKMIYIDPPYNTGNDSFVYPDDYAERLDAYNKRAGITDETGYLNKQDLWRKSSRDNGQFHAAYNKTLKEFIRERSLQQVVCLDSAFEGRDEDLSNFKLELKEAGIELTIL